MSEHTLLLRLAGPLQSWGLSGQFTTRDTAQQPTKSGVIGLLSAALGRPRGADIDDLIALRLGVRSDQPGIILRDYHTVSRLGGEPIPAASGAKAPTNITKVTERDYLSDASFVAGLAASKTDAQDLLHQLDHALEHPAFALSLGRRSCPPQGRVSLGVVNTSLSDALINAEWQTPPAQRRAGAKLRLSIDDPTGEDVINDVPINFAPLRRGFRARRVTHTWISPPGSDTPPSGALERPHDPFALLDW